MDNTNSVIPSNDDRRPKKRSEVISGDYTVQCNYVCEDGRLCGKRCKGERGLMQHRQRSQHFDEKTAQGKYRCTFHDATGVMCNKLFIHEASMMSHQRQTHDPPTPKKRKLNIEPEGDPPKKNPAILEHYSLKDQWKGPETLDQLRKHRLSGHEFEQNVAEHHHHQQSYYFPVVPSAPYSHTMASPAQPHHGPQEANTAQIWPVALGPNLQQAYYPQRQSFAHQQSFMPPVSTGYTGQASSQYLSQPIMPGDERPLEFVRGTWNEPSEQEKQDTSPSGHLHGSGLDSSNENLSNIPGPANEGESRDYWR